MPGGHRYGIPRVDRPGGGRCARFSADREARAGYCISHCAAQTAHPFFQQPNPSRALAEDIERTIETSGIEWTYLRAGMFALNARHFWGPQIRAGDVVRWPYLAAPTAPVDERDIAAVAVRTLTEDGHAGMEYVLTGAQSLSQHEQISI
jgi:uncharacterized protein YbjT (DUF2867 family)